MEASTNFSTGQLFLTDARLYLGVANHLRHQALGRVFGLSREQSNVLTVVALLGAADAVYEGGRRLGAIRPPVPSSNAALGALALRDAAIGAVAPASRGVPGFGGLVTIAVLGGLAAPALRRAAHRMHIAEQHLRASELQVRRARIRRYVAAREHARSRSSG